MDIYNNHCSLLYTGCRFKTTTVRKAANKVNTPQSFLDRKMGKVVDRVTHHNVAVRGSF